MKRMFLVATLAALAALSLAQVAAAAGPTVERNQLAFSLTDQGCGGDITYDINLVGSEVIQDFGDRLTTHTTFRGGVLASDGTELRVLHTWREDYDFVSMTLTITGMPFGTRVEGSSIGIHDRGRIVIDLTTFEPVFLAGKFNGPADPHAWTCQLIAAAQG